jgi:IS1 family transposase
LRVRGSSQPFSKCDYGPFLPPFAAASKVFRIQSDLLAVVNLNKEAASRYSPAEVVSTEKTIVTGMPDVSKICTSHVECQKLTLRMHCRRLTRLTKAFSKKFKNFQAAVALNFAYYNFCKVHGSLRMTPAMAAGVETSIWTVAEPVKACGE